MKTHIKIQVDPLFASDLITSGLVPLLQETDYRVINKEDFTQFTEVKDAYNPDGDWQDIENFDTRRSYNPNEKVPKGRTWTMLDEDGSSGLTPAENPN